MAARLNDPNEEKLKGAKSSHGQGKFKHALHAWPPERSAGSQRQCVSQRDMLTTVNSTSNVRIGECDLRVLNTFLR